MPTVIPGFADVHGAVRAVCFLVLLMSAPALGAAIRAGDRVRVVRGPAPVKIGTKTVTEVPQGAGLIAEKLKGDWVFVRVRSASSGSVVAGWIHKSRLGPASMAAANSEPRPVVAEILLKGRRDSFSMLVTATGKWLLRIQDRKKCNILLPRSSTEWMRTRAEFRFRGGEVVRGTVTGLSSTDVAAFGLQSVEVLLPDGRVAQFRMLDVADWKYLDPSDGIPECLPPKWDGIEDDHLLKVSLWNGRTMWAWSLRESAAEGELVLDVNGREQTMASAEIKHIELLPRPRRSSLSLGLRRGVFAFLGIFGVSGSRVLAGRAESLLAYGLGWLLGFLWPVLLLTAIAVLVCVEVFPDRYHQLLDSTIGRPWRTIETRTVESVCTCSLCKGSGSYTRIAGPPKQEWAGNLETQVHVVWRPDTVSGTCPECGGTGSSVSTGTEEVYVPPLPLQYHEQFLQAVVIMAIGLCFALISWPVWWLLGIELARIGTSLTALALCGTLTGLVLLLADGISLSQFYVRARDRGAAIARLIMASVFLAVCVLAGAATWL